VFARRRKPVFPLTTRIHLDAATAAAGLAERVTRLADGTRVFSRAGGQGPPLVLVHGLAVTSSYLVPAAHALAASFAVDAPDLPGFGRRTDRPPSPLRLSTAVDALAAWAAASGLARASFLGHSYGCEIAVELALRRPELVERLVLVGPTPDPRRRDVFNLAGRLVLDGVLEPPRLAAIQIRDYALTGMRQALATAVDTLRDPIELKLPHVGVPALVVRGDRDPIVSQEWAERAAALLPDGRLHVVRGARHVVPYTHARELAAAVTSFMGAS
jgi:pimeloyl-ACP methyl ester carboxylesterase